MQPEIQVTTNAIELTKAFEALGGYVKRSPEIKAAFKEASKYLISKGRSRLKSRMKNSASISRSMTYQLFRNKKGSLVGFKIPASAALPEDKWLCMRAAVFNTGTKIRRTKKGYNRGVIKGNKFWTDTNEADTPAAMNIITNAIQASISKIMSR